MTNLEERNFADFEALISVWKGAYQCAVYSYVALKTAEGPRILFARVLLEPSRTGISDSPFKFETTHLMAGRVVTGISASDVAAIIEHAKAGEAIGAEGLLSLASDQNGRLSTYFAPIYHPFISDGPRLPSLLVRGISKHNLLVMSGDTRQLDWELKAAVLPFDTLDELLGYCALPGLVQMGDSTTLEIVAKSPSAIDPSSKIINEEAVIECRMAKALDVDKLRLGYRIFRKGQQIDRGSANGKTFAWREEGDLRVGTYRMLVMDVSFLQVFLSYDGVSLHQWWVSDPQKHLNPRHAIHQVFDEDMELLRRMLLKPETDKPYIFEGTVSTLCNLLGFSVVNYGRIPKLQKGPDIIAVTPTGHIGVVECTVGLLDENDKLAKLVQRAKLIKQKLTEVGYGHLEIQPVIVTPLSRDEVVASLDTAGKHGIAVICKENLEELLNQVGLPPNADRLFQDAKRLIPVSNQGSLF